MIDELESASDIAVCPSCGEQNLSAARYCMHCGARMAVDEGERRTVTVMFVNVSGFMTYAETAVPEDLRTLADTVTTRLIGIVQRFGGTLDKIIGENGLKVMAIFGAPAAHEDDPERAVRAALAMQDEANAHPDAFAGLRLSIGVHTGEAIYAPVGTSGDYTVLGDTVNTAARLMGAAAEGEVLIGAVTARAVEDSIELHDVPPIPVKNKAEPVEASHATGIRGHRAIRTRTRAPLVGREASLDTLRESWAYAIEHRRASSATIVGAPGLGKTRLLGTFCDERAGDARLVTGHCLSYGEGITYWPIIEILTELAGIKVGDSTDIVSRKLGEMLEALGTEDLDELGIIAVAVANLVAAPTTPRGTYSARSISRQELHWGIRRLLQLLSLQRPLIVAIEDLHWAEPTLLRLLEFILDDDEAAQLLLLATARTEFKDAAPAYLDPKLNRRVAELQPLTDGEAEELLVSLVGEAGRSSLQPLLDAAGGNPLFLEEIVQMLVDTGLVDRDGTPTGRLDRVPIPTSLHALIAARLDRLPAREKRIAGRAAVVGRVFWAGAVRRLDPDADAERALATLIEKDILFPVQEPSIAGEREYAFKHVMLRDVAYDRIPKADRAVLHERCGRWIGEIPGSAEEYIEFVAHHFEQATLLAMDARVADYEPPTLAAVNALRRAGEKAEGHEGTAEADRFYERALALIGDRYPETATEIRYNRARTIGLLGKMDDAAAELHAVASLATETGRNDLTAAALTTYAHNVGLTQSKPDEARAALDRAYEIATRANDIDAQINIKVAQGNIRVTQQQDIDGLSDLVAALDLAADTPNLERRAEALYWCAQGNLNLGNYREAEQLFTELLDMANDLGSIRWEAVATRPLGVVKYYRGPRDEAEALLLGVLDWTKRLSDWLTEIQTRWRLADIAIARGDLAAAEEWARSALPLAGPGGPLVQAIAYCHLAEVHALHGNIEDASAAARHARAAATIDHPLVQAFTSLAEAFAARASGVEAVARERFEDAIAKMDHPSLDTDRSEAQMAYGRALLAFGDVDGGRAQLSLARETFERMGARAMVDDIDRALADDD